MTTNGGETTYYHYDGCGNTVAKQEVSGTTYYQFNTENLMTRIDFAAGSSYYQYDADSKRVSQRTADGFRQFVYQGPDMLKLQSERDESEGTVAHYTMGAGLEAMRRTTSSFYHYNHLGTTLALTGADEAVSDTYRHDAWGVLLASTGSTVNPHTYVGRERYYRMPNAAMYHLGFRDYAQGLGRFTTVDPVRDGTNWLVYVINTPVARSDPRGLAFHDSCDAVYNFKWLDEVERALREAPGCKAMPSRYFSEYRALARCIILAESTDDPSAGKSSRNAAKGLFQILPLDLHVRNWETVTGCDFWATWDDPWRNILYGVNLMCDDVRDWDDPVGGLTIYPTYEVLKPDVALDRVINCMACLDWVWVPGGNGGGHWIWGEPVWSLW